MKENLKDLSRKQTADKQELLIVAMLDYLIEHGDYRDIEAVALDIENKMKGIGLYEKWVHEMSGQNLHDRNAAFHIARLPKWKEAER